MTVGGMGFIPERLLMMMMMTMITGPGFRPIIFYNYCVERVGVLVVLLLSHVCCVILHDEHFLFFRRQCRYDILLRAP